MLKTIHLELTNKCTLKCPRCSRTTFIDKFGIHRWQNQDLNLEHLKQFLDIDLAGVDFRLCGNYGDPIYYPELFEFVAWAKSKLATVTLITNGSYKTRDWWQTLVSQLTNQDKVYFSIDGMPDSFTQYRINGDWSSIQIGLEVVGASDVQSVWKFIPFKFNQDQIDQARSLAASYGIKEFAVEMSDRWEPEDELKPTAENLINVRNQSIISWKQNNNRDASIDPKCRNGTEHYISAEGYYMPCCYVGEYNFYYKTEFYKNREHYSISNHTITTVLDSIEVKQFYSTIQEAKPAACTFNCPQV